MMKEQHKAMFISLRDGQFDHLVEDGGEKKAAKPAEVKAARAQRPLLRKCQKPPPPRRRW